MQIEDAGFSTRTYNILRRSGCKKMGDVIATGVKKILAGRCCGIKAICEINAKFAEYGCKLPGFDALMQMEQKIASGNKHRVLRYLP